MNAQAAIAPRTRLTGYEIYGVLFGLFLGLAIIKFGNPVILDQKVVSPESFHDFLADSWPTFWGIRLLGLLAVPGICLALFTKSRWKGCRCFWALPIIWFGWQIISATRTVDGTLTEITLWHFAGCLACYFLGVFVISRDRAFRWLLVGLLAAFAFCLVRAANQRLVEFPRDRQTLVEGESSGWTNFPPDVLQRMKQDQLIIHTNGVDVVNPALIAKLTKRRVHGTFVYPNALAGAILLLWPVAIGLAFGSAQFLRPLVRKTAIVFTLLLGGAALFWTGSKSGWLIALMLAGAWMFRLNWPKRWKWSAFICVIVVGLALFAFRFHNYFAAGATSVGARFDYWRAAVQIARTQPLVGSGPGTFQRPYSELKLPEAEMARLVHNDYLEQFCDSGIIGGISYAAWIGLALGTVGRHLSRHRKLSFVVFLGLLGWFVQGLSEFSLYIPAVAWVSFTFLGWLLVSTESQFGKTPVLAGK